MQRDGDWDDEDDEDDARVRDEWGGELGDDDDEDDNEGVCVGVCIVNLDELNGGLSSWLMRRKWRNFGKMKKWILMVFGDDGLYCIVLCVCILLLLLLRV